MIKITFLLLFFITNALAWGPNGHRIVGEIARQNLKPSTISSIKALLGHDNLALVSTWADEMKSNPQWNHAYSWHFINIKDGESYNSKKHGENNIVGAIKKFTAVLKDSKKSTAERAIALKFLVHFVGDFHQPWHVGRPGEKGGHVFKVKWFGRNTNIHVVWDKHMIEHEHLSYSEWVSWYGQASANQKNQWQSNDMDQWIKENMQYRKTIYQGFKNTKKWEYKYKFNQMAIVREQLLKGGLRLAYLLNSTL